MAPKAASKKTAKKPAHKPKPSSKPAPKAVKAAPVKAVSKKAETAPKPEKPPTMTPPAPSVTSAPKSADLGTKRQCPKCASMFYDFSKPEIFCPKCGHQLDLSKLKPVLPPAPPKPAPVRKEALDPDAVVATDSDFESLDDLGGDDDAAVVEITTDDDSDNDENN